MLHKKFAAGILAALAAGTFASVMVNAKDPVVMTVAGHDVPLSEFQYLYNKNNIQQQSKQSIGDYVKSFVDYKLRVAQALEERLDTLPAYKKEFEQHRSDLAEQYLVDSVALDSMVRVVYDRMHYNVDTDHLMLSLSDADHTTAQQQARLDSLRTLITNGKADFYELAKQHSIDPSVKANGGHIGYVVANTFPAQFEDMVFNTPDGQLSPVFRTRYGWHLIRVNGRRNDVGEVKASHILKLTRNANDEIKAKKKHQIDSIYKALSEHRTSFAATAQRESEDPGSGRNGGSLGWFGSGRMVPQFEQAAFALQPGEMSKPIATDYGWHIIFCEDRRGIAPLDSIRQNIESSMHQGERAELLQDRGLAPFAKRYPAKINATARDSVFAIVTRTGKLTPEVSNLIASYTKIPAITVNGKTVSLGEIGTQMSRSRTSNVESAMELYDLILANQRRSMTRDAAMQWLEKNEPAYRYLLNEYRDGMLYFDISTNKVWDYANKDVEGQQKYFQSHRNKYLWNAPKYKGYLISAVNDSLASIAANYVSTNNIPTDSLVRKLRTQFGNDVKIERALAAKGENPVIDYVAFNGFRPAPIGRWSAFRPVLGKIIEQPEDASDVRGAVSVDYQKELEAKWLEELRAKYPVKINAKVLKKVK